MCKTEYSESCILNFNITDVLFKYYLDNNLSYNLINGIRLPLELTQDGKANSLTSLTSLTYICFNYYENKVEIVSFKTDVVDDIQE